ncbi:AimR family lysis-lysogeny pheromone receptor [Bacillus thuringiensis]|uniref:AimR family lysis-lysogeny pheromone receptor n=1 Tax=Bacillus thuringiensis TaxID=1428 RepID=UPI002224F677|nr:AimR family lysis-lysogeny pheromone receptor [Bacillus thuringiensis]UYX53325.1 AimR family lysis-lysogeny pheromone receptor [Bacillus thuringiensis]
MFGEGGSEFVKELMKKIKKQAEKMELTFPDIQRKTGVDRVVISDAVTGNTAEMKFDNFLLVASVLFEDMDERKDILNEFISLMKSPLNIRKSLVYYQGIGEFESMDSLIETHKDNDKLKKYLCAYKFFNMRNKNERKGQLLIDELDKKSFSMEAECGVLINMLYSFSMYDIFNIRAMHPYSDKVEKNLDKMEKGFIKSCLEVHYKDRVAYIKLFNDELEECRKKCNEILKSCLEIPVIKATALCCIGESYMIQDQIISEKWILDSIDYLDKHGVSHDSRKYKAFNTTLNYLYIEFGFNLDKINFDYIDKSELGYYIGLYEDKEKGLEMIYNLVKERGSSPFTDYYIARINEDLEGLEKALMRFERVANYHYAKAVQRTIELLKKKQGEVERV